MIPDINPRSSTERLRALQGYGTLDTPREPAFDELVTLAAHSCGTPGSLITLLDHDRQWFKAAHGIDLLKTPLDASFYAYVVQQPGDLVVVPDTALDPRFADSAFVIGEPRIRFYAGVPLRTRESHAIGTLCVVDHRPRVLTADQAEALRVLGRQVIAQLELRREIAKHRIADARLLASELRYRRLFEAAKDGILILNAETGMIDDVNPFLTDLLGLTQSEVLQKRVWELGSFNQLIANFEKFQELQRNDYVRYENLPLVAKDGHLIDVEFVSNVYDVEGVRVIQCNIRDITEQKKIESRQIRSQRMESIGTLAGGIAHDLNNVLAPILMSIELLKTKSGAPSHSAEILEIIHTSCKRGADLVRQVLSFARGVEGLRISLNLSHLIEDLRQIIGQTFPRNIDITCRASKDLWPVLGDPTQLHQVLLNLAVNARDAMENGGKLAINTGNRLIEARHDGILQEPTPGSYVLLQVIDTGCGILPEVRERIFEPFFTTKDLGKGTGLGLAIVYTIIKAHGGFIFVESEKDHGTTFKIYLPADPARLDVAASPILAVPSALPRGRDELVLVVDDESSIREVTRATLEAFGYRVLIAKDGAEAVKIYTKEQANIALVLTDMMMPVMDGAATIRVIRQINPQARIIAASGLDIAGNIVTAVRAGVHDFLPKPYSAGTLLQRIREVLDRPAKRQT